MGQLSHAARRRRHQIASELVRFMTTLPLAVPLRGAAWLAVQPVTASATVITATNTSAIFIGFSPMGKVSGSIFNDW